MMCLFQENCFTERRRERRLLQKVLSMQPQLLHLSPQKMNLKSLFSRTSFSPSRKSHQKLLLCRVLSVNSGYFNRANFTRLLLKLMSRQAPLQHFIQWQAPAIDSARSVWSLRTDFCSTAVLCGISVISSTDRSICDQLATPPPV